MTTEGKDKYFGRLISEPPSNRKAIRRVLNTDREKSLQLFEEVFADKIISDIAYILDKGWADEISETDFFHGHGSFRSNIALSCDYASDLRTIISLEHVDLNYHTKERIRPRGEQCNIYSSSYGLPMVISPHLIVRGVIYFHFDFQLDENGHYILPPNRIYREERAISIQFTMMNQ